MPSADPSAADSPSPSPLHRWLARVAWCVAASPLLVMGFQGWRQRWISDDGMINVRIARMLLEGHGPVFNVAERVEAYTSALWMFTIAGLGSVGVELEVGAAMGGLALTLMGIACAMGGAMKIRRMSWSARDLATAGAVPLGMLVYAVIPVAWDFATSGLETGLTLAWIGATFWVLTAWTDAQKAREVWLWRAALGLLSLGPILRPELSLYSLLAGAMLTGSPPAPYGEGARRWLRGVGEAALWLGAIPVTYQIWRMGYFATLTPNTALAKEAFEPRWDQGWRFFENTFGLYHLLAPLGLLGVMAWGHLRDLYTARQWRRAAVFALPLACGIFYVVYVMRVGGGFMHGRMFLPAIFFILTPVAVVRLSWADRTRSWRIPAACLILGWAILCAAVMRVERENRHGIGDERGWYARSAGHANPIRIEDYQRFGLHKDAVDVRDQAIEHCGSAEALDDVRCPDEAVVMLAPRRNYGRVRGVPGRAPAKPGAVAEGVGAVIHRTAIGIRGVVVGPGVHIADHVGLADPFSSRLRLTKRGRPGHEKRMHTFWFVARFMAPHPRESKRIQTAREVLKCAPIVELMEAVRAPMTAERFWSNIKLAPRLHQLRIDPDPVTAREQLCSPPTDS